MTTIEAWIFANEKKILSFVDFDELHTDEDFVNAAVNVYQQMNIVHDDDDEFYDFLHLLTVFIAAESLRIKDLVERGANNRYFLKKEQHE